VTLLMGFLAIMTTFIGLRTTPVLQLAALVVIVIAGPVADHLLPKRRPSLT